MTHRLAFIMDQQVGLRTQSLNLEQAIAEDPTVAATWVPVRYESPAGLISRLPGIPSGIKGTLKGVKEIREGLGDARQFDSLLWATWAAKSVPDLVEAKPSFLVMDMTPTQMEEMGERYGYHKSRARLFGGWKRRATQRIYEQAKLLFPWNDWVAASLIKDWSVPKEKIVSITPGVDLELFHPDESRTDDGVARILFVGGDFERKGGDLLLRWARETRVSSPWELHIVTRDNVPETPGVVVHHGITNNSPELVRLYQQSDLFVLPTRADCYSLVTMEAMACGLPVIITHLGGIPELIREGETGHLIAPDDYETLAARLNALVENGSMRRTMGMEARRHAQAHFDCRLSYRRMLDAMKAAS